MSLFSCGLVSRRPLRVQDEYVASEYDLMVRACALLTSKCPFCNARRSVCVHTCAHTPLS